MLTREFRNSSKTGKVRVWTVRVEGRMIYTQWGDEGGKFQTGEDFGVWKNRGQSNEITPEQDAFDTAERMIREKLRAGYVEGAGAVVLSRSLDLTRRLPEQLRVYKPDNSLGPTLLKRMRARQTLFTRKRDGEAYPLVTHVDREITMYSRKMHRHHHLEEGGPGWEARFPQIVEEVRSLDLPPETMLLGELVFLPDRDMRWNTAQIIRSKTDEALEMQARVGHLHYYVWDIAWWAGKCLLTTETLGERYARIYSLLEGRGVPHLLPVEVYSPDDIDELAAGISDSVLEDEHEFGIPVIPEDAPPLWRSAIKVALRYAWEGWVVVDPDAQMGPEAYNLRGKDYRPAAVSGKLKPFFEDDFVLVFDPNSDFGEIDETLGQDLPERGSWGRGKEGVVGAVSLYQRDASGKLVYICECGGGITDDFIAQYSDPEKYPLVAEVRYETRTYTSLGGKTNALQFPRIIRVRTDKTPDECINTRL